MPYNGIYGRRRDERSFSVSPTNVDYNTVAYNELPRTMSNSLIALKAFLTQRGYEDISFTTLATTEQLITFGQYFCRRGKPSVEKCLKQSYLADTLGILHSDLEEVMEGNNYASNGVGSYVREFATERGISTNQIFDWQRIVRNSYINTHSHSHDFLGESIADTMRREEPQRRRSVQSMLMEIIKGEDFPKPNFVNWTSDRELQEIANDWYNNVEYKEQWIFSRREREGFNRRNIGQFSLSDVLGRISKRKNPHHLDTSNSKIYDWKLGGTDWILRLELYTFENDEYEDLDETLYFLICRHIHKPTNAEIKFEIRHWNGEKFRSITNLWTQTNDNESHIERHLSNTHDERISVRQYDPFVILETGDENGEEDEDIDWLEDGEESPW